MKYVYESISVVVGALILVINYLYIAPEYPVVVPILNVIGALIAVAPPSFIFYSRYKTKKEMEAQFLVFIQDLTDSINTGMTLPMALEHISKRNYFSLTPHVNKLSAQVNWGIPFEKALRTFAKKTDILTIKRAVTTIIETYKVGGKISDTLTAVGRSLVTIDKINKERASSVHAQIVTSYLIFFIFIFILVVLQVFLIPALIPATGGVPGISGLGAAAAPVPTEVFSASFVNFIVIQGFFAGLVTGKMAENSVLAGIKHSILLIAIGYTLFSFSSQFSVVLF